MAKGAVKHVTVITIIIFRTTAMEILNFYHLQYANRRRAVVADKIQRLFNYLFI